MIKFQEASLPSDWLEFRVVFYIFSPYLESLARNLSVKQFRICFNLGIFFKDHKYFHQNIGGRDSQEWEMRYRFLLIDCGWKNWDSSEDFVYRSRRDQMRKWNAEIVSKSIDGSQSLQVMCDNQRTHKIFCFYLNGLPLFLWNRGEKMKRSHHSTCWNYFFGEFCGSDVEYLTNVSDQKNFFFKYKTSSRVVPIKSLFMSNLYFLKLFHRATIDIFH